MVELLTVIAIIAILLAILFPVFAQVRIKVQETRCMNNLHQISKAIRFQGQLGQIPDGAERLRRHDRQKLQSWSGTLFFQYLKSEESLHCPTSVYRDIDANVNFS